MRGLSFFCLFFLSVSAFAQQKVYYYSSDSLRITADLYMKDANKPFILLFHQAESSRGEYKDIAPKLANLGYNCLAVDLRSGDKINYVKNETAELAKKQKLGTGFLEARKDIEASLDYIRRYNRKPCVLFGSSYSASLALLVAGEYSNVEAVIAFSPGEYFRPAVNVKENLNNLDIPVFAAASEMEYKFVKELLEDVPEKNKTVFKPKNGRGVHGAKALWENSEGSTDYWWGLTHFFRSLKKS